MKMMIKLKDVMKLTALSKATIYRFIKEGVFPKQVLLGANSVVWIEEEVVEWLEEKIAQRDSEA